MKATLFAGILVLAIFIQIACDQQRVQAQSNSTQLNVILTSDRPWTVGEAKTCSLDGEWNEMHCFPPEDLRVPQTWHKYMVKAEFAKAPHFDEKQWAYDIVCRLDSFNHATCQNQREGEQ